MEIYNHEIYCLEFKMIIALLLFQVLEFIPKLVSLNIFLQDLELQVLL